MAVKLMRERYDWLKTGPVIDALPLAVDPDPGLEVVVILVAEVVGVPAADLAQPQRAGHVPNLGARGIPDPNQRLLSGNPGQEVIPKSSLITALVPHLQVNQNLT